MVFVETMVTDGIADESLYTYNNSINNNYSCSVDLGKWIKENPLKNTISERLVSLSNLMMGASRTHFDA